MIVAASAGFWLLKSGVESFFAAGVVVSLLVLFVAVLELESVQLQSKKAAANKGKQFFINVEVLCAKMGAKTGTGNFF
jgi:hypothetical protein